MSDTENNGPVMHDSQAGGEPSVVKPADVIGNGVAEVGPAGDGLPNEDKEKAEEQAQEADEEEEEDDAAAEDGEEEEEEGEESEEEEGDEEEEELQPGLLERPVILEAGRKRERKKTDRLETSFTTPSHKNVDVPEGSGTRLGDIEAIEAMLKKARSEDLKPLHRVLYGRAGGATEVKKNIRKFCGFTFAVDSAEYNKRLQTINKFTISVLKSLCDILKLERSGTKEALVERVIEYLLHPASDGKPPKERRRSSTKKRRRRRTKLEMEEARKQEALLGRPVKRPDSEGSEQEEEEDGSAAAESSEAEEAEEAEQSTKKTKADTPKRTPKKTPKKTKESRKSSDKSTTKSAEKKQKAVTPKKRKRDTDENATEEPVTKSKKKPPSDDELRDLVKKILDGANLEEITMKTVCKQVYDKYPAFDLTPRKDFIKTTVKAIIK